jgi:branched-chain amino acid transport system permease protein
MNWTDLTQGPLGLTGIPRPNILGINFNENINFLLLTLIIAVITYLIIKKITVSRFGKVLEATRDNELAAKSLGKNTARAKAISLMTAAFFAGIAGSLFGFYLNFLNPGSFNFSNIIPLIVIVMIGGLGSLEGTVLATILIILLPEPLRFIGLPSTLIGPGQQMIYAVLLLVILSYQPKGFYGRQLTIALLRLRKVL